MIQLFLYQICKDKDEAETWFIGLKALISRGRHRTGRSESRSDGVSSEANSPRANTQRSSPLSSPFGSGGSSQKVFCFFLHFSFSSLFDLLKGLHLFLKFSFFYSFTVHHSSICCFEKFLLVDLGCGWSPSSAYATWQPSKNWFREGVVRCDILCCASQGFLSPRFC